MRVHLNGGPMHDQCVDVPDDVTHFHIKEATPDSLKRALELSSPDIGLQLVPVREGMYSQVTGPGTRQEFEWDGWRGHE